MTREVFTAGMARLIATWPDRSPSATTHAAYWEACCHLDDTVWAEKVVARHTEVGVAAFGNARSSPSPPSS